MHAEETPEQTFHSDGLLELSRHYQTKLLLWASLYWSKKFLLARYRNLFTEDKFTSWKPC